ncbi:hypothetical protein BGZ46_001257 [Entomortierella lignicola]|nr:hypothetical protein BGZ46_001257 [Entomortierella lignicola]
MNSIKSIPTNESEPELELELVRATDPQVIKQVWLNNREHFANDIPTDIWLEKSALRTSLDLGPGIEHKIWVLVPKGKGHDPTAILSSVHTYERPGFMSTPTPTPSDLTTKSGIKALDVVIVYVLLVFTPVKHRKQGYARKMLKMLGDQLKSQTNPTVSLSFLYSSVGPNFYESSGWPKIRSRELVMEVPDHVFPDLPPDCDATKKYHIKDITESNIQEIMDKDIELLRLEVSTKAQNASQNQRFAAILPEARVFRGQQKIADFTNRRISQINKPISRIGVRLVSDEMPEDEHPFMIWTNLVPYKLLLILKTRYKTVHQLQILLKEAMKEARDWDMTTMSLWDLNEEAALQATGIPNRDRTVAWSCLNQFEHSEQIELLVNEAFIWGL